VSGYILDELSKVLSEDLGRNRCFVSLARKAALRIAKFVSLPPAIRSRVPGDPNDDPIFQTALSARAEYLLTADTEILAVGKVEDVAIISASQFDRLLWPERSS
jgi:predicted nucleic acid-binding protein